MSSAGLANFFMSKSLEDDIELNRVQLQRFMFIGFGWVLALTNKDLTNGEGFVPSEVGPINPSTYYQLVAHAMRSVQAYCFVYSYEDYKLNTPIISDEVAVGILEKCWLVYREFSTASMKDLVCKEGTPWSNALKGNRDYHKRMSFDAIELYYHQELTELLDDN